MTTIELKMYAMVILSTLADLGKSPSGPVYAAIMDKVDIMDYNTILDVLERAGWITHTRAHSLSVRQLVSILGGVLRRN